MVSSLLVIFLVQLKVSWNFISFMVTRLNCLWPMADIQVWCPIYWSFFFLYNWKSIAIVLISVRHSENKCFKMLCMPLQLCNHGMGKNLKQLGGQKLKCKRLPSHLRPISDGEMSVCHSPLIWHGSLERIISISNYILNAHMVQLTLLNLV